MTIILKTAPAPPPPPPADQEGLAQIVLVDLPDSLFEGEPVTGTVRIKNVGAIGDKLQVSITTEWDSKLYKASADIPVGYTYTVNLTVATGIVMPAQDAVITIRAQHDQDGAWVTDDQASH